MNKLEILGFNSMDGFFALTALCAGALGALADYICKRSDFENLPVDRDPKGEWRAYVPLFIIRVLIGGLGGALIWIVLFDILEHDAQSFMRLLFLSFIAGLVAPSFINAYQKKALKLLNKPEGID